jgi:RND family efflux transporter MFP subunit
MKNFILGFLIASALAGGYWFVAKKPSQQVTTARKAAQRYYCPMHPTYVSDKPGDCPICGMRLVPMETSTAEDKKSTASDEHARHPSPGAEPQRERKPLYYVDPMNPQHRSDKPGKAPDGMDLVPVYPDESSAESTRAVPGYVPVRINPERQRLMGITLDEARLTNLEQSIRTVGRVTYDETRLHHVHTKFEGFIEELFADFVGKFVKKGDPLFSVYSPELVATQKEYLLALRAKDQLATSDSDVSWGEIDLLEAARQRLSLWDIGADQMARLEKTRQPMKALVIRSPVSGFVSAKTALQGMRVMPGDNLYDIIDLSSVWVLADVYEINLPFVKVGQPAEMTLPYQPGRVWKGRVAYLNPTLDEKTRTVKVRLEFANPAGLLKPEMYADVVLKGSLGRGIAVPESAVISTGERMIVFVAKEEGIFEPREVSTGVKVRNFYEIKSGVTVGEKVVTGANFLLDSESKLKASLSGMGSGHQHGQ